MNTFWVEAIDKETFILRCEVDRLKLQMKAMQGIVGFALDTLVQSGALLKSEKDSLQKELARAGDLEVECRKEENSDGKD